MLTWLIEWGFTSVARVRILTSAHVNRLTLCMAPRYLDGRVPGRAWYRRVALDEAVTLMCSHCKSSAGSLVWRGFKSEQQRALTGLTLHDRKHMCPVEYQLKRGTGE